MIAEMFYFPYLYSSFRLYMPILFTLLYNISCLMIQERLTDMYLSSPLNGSVQLVTDQNLASIYELIPLAGSNVSYGIKDMETKFVLTYRKEDGEIISTAFNDEPNHEFQIIVDVNGYFQIRNHKNKYIYYNKDLDKLVGGEFNPENMMGFRIFENDGKKAFPSSE